ncbi:MAG TPA: zf-HC2 domain-containing protein [Actinomycetes bacterium]
MTVLTCRELVELVTDHLERALSPDAQREFVAHLAQCEDCLRYFAQIQQTVRLLATLEASRDA